MNQWNNYPTGPTVSKWLGLNPTSEFGEVTDESRQGFGDYLVQSLEERKIESKDQFIDVLDELVAMNLPAAILRVKEHYPMFQDHSDFRYLFAVAVASMLTGDFETAIQYFGDAQDTLPEEPAPYVNLAQIYLELDRVDEALTWCEAGLRAEANNTNLWIIFRDIQHSLNPDKLFDAIKEKSKELKSWRGASLQASFFEDSEKRRLVLEEVYNEGEREPEFLVEYTGILGENGDYGKIHEVVLEASSLSSKELPWQLLLHDAQAYFTIGQDDLGKEVTDRILAIPETPLEIKEQIKNFVGSLSSN